jgi:hypothetical protein
VICVCMVVRYREMQSLVTSLTGLKVLRVEASHFDVQVGDFEVRMVMDVDSVKLQQVQVVLGIESSCVAMPSGISCVCCSATLLHCRSPLTRWRLPTWLKLPSTRTTCRFYCGKHACEWSTWLNRRRIWTCSRQSMFLVCKIP